jgi:hypothetical protein
MPSSTVSLIGKFGRFEVLQFLLKLKARDEIELDCFNPVGYAFYFGIRAPSCFDFLNERHNSTHIEIILLEHLTRVLSKPQTRKARLYALELTGLNHHDIVNLVENSSYPFFSLVYMISQFEGTHLQRYNPALTLAALAMIDACRSSDAFKKLVLFERSLGSEFVGNSVAFCVENKLKDIVAHRYIEQQHWEVLDPWSELKAWNTSIALFAVLLSIARYVLEVLAVIICYYIPAAIVSALVPGVQEVRDSVVTGTRREFQGWVRLGADMLSLMSYAALITYLAQLTNSSGSWSTVESAAMFVAVSSLFYELTELWYLGRHWMRSSNFIDAFISIGMIVILVFYCLVLPALANQWRREVGCGRS